jgi:guanosine-3',5'-bis(diphosphate) 3'-pyrophosphohydrolase
VPTRKPKPGARNPELAPRTEAVLRAFRYAALKHRHQYLADGVTPYFAHVARVCWILRDLFGIRDLDTVVATILHDVVEDTNTPLGEIEECFGKTIAEYVDLLTKDERLPKSRREREYHEKLLNAPETVQIAKLADIYDNLSRRVGTPRLASTLKKARSFVAAFDEKLASPHGRIALDHVRRLISQIEDGTVSGGF